MRTGDELNPDAPMTLVGAANGLVMFEGGSRTTKPPPCTNALPTWWRWTLPKG